MENKYDDKILNNMISLYNSLSEKDRRRYAAIEAMKLGFGGIVYISDLFSCDEKTISKGISELSDEERMNQEKIRNTGGGRISKLDKFDNIDEIFLEVLRKNTAGSPMDEKVKWTNLTRSEIREAMLKKGLNVSKNVVKKLLKKHEYVKRKALKKKQLVKTKIETHSLRKYQNFAVNMRVAITQ